MAKTLLLSPKIMVARRWCLAYASLWLALLASSSLAVSPSPAAVARDNAVLAHSVEPLKDSYDHDVSARV